MMINQVCIRIAVSGITGRMGKMIAKSVIAKQKNNQKIVLSGAIARLNSECCGVDVGTLVDSRVLGVTITDKLELIRDDFDVLIDFTNSAVSMEYLRFCILNKKNMIIGTTGFNMKQQNLIKYASQKIGIVYSANFSIGVTLMLKLLNDITQIIGKTSNINIIEAHHNKKRDAPSGTALMMKEIIVGLLQKQQYSHSDVNIHSIRAGDIVGEHSVLFTGLGEQLKIVHTASDRMIFASGAVCAAIWLGCSKVGLFTMNDVLKGLGVVNVN